MPLSKRRVWRWPVIDMPVSYKVLAKDKMADALNVVTNQNLLETRPGYSRYNSQQISSTKEINSISYFKDNSGTIRVLAKVQEDVYSVSESGAHVLVDGGFVLDEDVLDEDFIDSGSGFTAANKHRAVTTRGRHIVAMGSNGMFSWDGTTWSQLGQAVPAAPTVGASGSGNTLTASDYQVAVTFYDSTNGFETNQGAASSTVTVASGEQIDVSSIAATADNGNIDKVRIYLKDVTAGGNFLFWKEINLGTTTDTIDDDPTSTQTPPEDAALPPTSAKYIALFGNKLVASGDSNFPSDVYFSTPDIPDAWDDSTTGTRLKASGQGPVTGLGTGFYNDENKAPFLCIFKRNSIEVYDETNGVSVISDDVGCVAHDTIRTINGAVFFMSTIGWHVISNGRIEKDKNNDAYELGDGDMSALFNLDGWVHSLAKNQLQNAHSVYYPTLNQYMTFASQSGRTDFLRSYNYELGIGGFRPYQFPLSIIDTCLAEASDGTDIVLMATEGGYIMKHSIAESRADTLADNTTQAIETFAQLFWLGGEDMDATFNFGPVVARALESDTAIEARYFLNFGYATPTVQDFDFSSDETGFVLDLSKLDEGVIGDGRTVVRYVGGVFRTAQALLVGFYQNTINKNMNLLEAQIDVQKNGSPNI